MAVYKILGENEPSLREKSKPVPKITPNIHKLLDNLAETMYDAGGVGLAAPQIGVPKRVFVVDIGEGLHELINPAIVRWSEEEEIDHEGCLSIPEKLGDVSRALAITLEGRNRAGETVTIEAEGYFARALQHETDHLDGVLFTDRAEAVYARPPESGADGEEREAEEP
ncbi:MAG: peptide deformylase [Gracilibacteraceae bacterium]|jgi:peptide deformylase|nr:peptide deformylase [Gracilibacteraceae bacterium]